MQLGIKSCLATQVQNPCAKSTKSTQTMKGARARLFVGGVETHEALDFPFVYRETRAGV